MVELQNGTFHGFVDPNAIPTPSGRPMSEGQLSIAGADIRAAADDMGPGVLTVPKFETEILDMVRRRFPFGQRIAQVPATGQPSRYFEQRGIPGAAFTDPYNLSQTAGVPLRSERSVPLKAISGQINFGLFGVELTRQQGVFNSLLAKDINDMLMGILNLHDRSLMRGSDTSLEAPTTNQYCGLMTQINRTFGVSSTASIVDSIKAEIAAMVSQEGFDVMPTAIVIHPQTLELIEQEERINQRQMTTVDVNDRQGRTIAGLKVPAITTAAGVLPFIPDVSVTAPAASVTETGKTDYKLLIVTESMIECHYLTTPVPRLFPLALDGTLATQYVGVLFSCIVAKGKATSTDPEGTPLSYAHSIGTVTR